MRNIANLHKILLSIHAVNFTNKSLIIIQFHVMVEFTSINAYSEK